MSSSASFPVTRQANGPISYQVFEIRLREHYNQISYDAVELALNALRKEDSWNQRIEQIKIGTITVPDQIMLEKKVQLLVGRLESEHPNALGEVSEERAPQDVSLGISDEIQLLPPGPVHIINKKALAVVFVLGMAA